MIGGSREARPLDDGGKRLQSVSERAYLLAMLFGREFELEANDFSRQIAGLAMLVLEPDGSPAMIARAAMRAAWRCGSVARIRGDAALRGCAAFRIALLARH